MGSDIEDVEAVGVPRLGDHQRNLCVSVEVRKVCGDDEGGKSVLRLQPMCLLLLLHSFARQKQARHPGDNQTAPVWFLWQLAVGLLPTLFAPESRGRWRQPCRQCRWQRQCRCELEDRSRHWRAQRKDRELSAGGNNTVVGGVWTKVIFLLLNIFSKRIKQEKSAFPRTIRDLIQSADKSFKGFCFLLSLPFFSFFYALLNC